MNKRITKVTTKTGDKGTTGMADGSRVSKADPIINSIGEIDELNSLIKIAEQKKFFDMNSKAIELKALSERQPGFDVNTAINNTKTEIKHGDVHTAPPSHTVDGHLQGSKD